MAKCTNIRQYKKLLEILSENPDISQGFSKRGKHEINLFWENSSVELNCLGPPIKDATGWRKVWTDWKSYVKKKLTHNKKEISSTGGGRNKLQAISDLEEEVIRLTDMNTNVDGIQAGLSFGKRYSTPNKSNEVQQVPPELPHQNLTESGEEIQFAEDHDISLMSVESNPRPASEIKQKKDNTIELIKSQISIQKELVQKISTLNENMVKYHSEISYNIKKVYRGIDRLYDVENSRLQETQRHNKAMEELMMKKIEIKQKIVDIELSKLD